MRRLLTGRTAALAVVVLIGGPVLSGCGIRATSLPVDAGAAPTRVSCAVSPGPATEQTGQPAPSAPPESAGAGLTGASASATAAAPSGAPAGGQAPPPQAGEGGPAQTIMQIYLVCSERVSPVPRAMTGRFTGRLGTAQALLTELEREPEPAEERAGFASEVPGGLALSGPAAGDPQETLRLNESPQELPSYALAQLVCTFAGTAAGAPDQSVVLGGPADSGPPRRYHCDNDLRTAPDAGATAGTEVR